MPNEIKKTIFLGAAAPQPTVSSTELRMSKDVGEQKTSKQACTKRGDSSLSNIALAHKLIAELYKLGVFEWIVCAGARNAPIVKALSLYRGLESSLTEHNSVTTSVGFANEGNSDRHAQVELKIIHFFEERSAGFFAIGRSKISRGPIAVLTTSGTAVAELLPAMMEAAYSGVPLVMVSADRPSSHWGTGAPQTVWQPGIFTKYSHPTICWDCSQQPAISLTPSPFREALDDLEANFPSHINISFEEPLIDAPVDSGYVQLSTLRASFKGSTAIGLGSGPGAGRITVSDEEAGAVEAEQRLASFRVMSRAPLVLLSSLTPAEASWVKPHIIRWKLPIYAEAHSQLREDSDLAPLMIRCGEELFNQSWISRSGSTEGDNIGAQSDGLFDSVIRIGGIPTTRLWRNLESSLHHWPVLSFSTLPFSGLARGREHALPLASLAKLKDGWEAPTLILANPEKGRGGESNAIPGPGRSHNTLKNLDFLSYHVPKASCHVPAVGPEVGLERLLVQYPDSEPGWVRRISRLIPPGSMVFLGNSLPIREWDLAAEYWGASCDPSLELRGVDSAKMGTSVELATRGLTILGNRGVNGIDGLVSTFLGAALPSRENWLILGDLSAAYDLAGLGLIHHLPKTTIRIVLINNGGGMIFNRLFKDPAFENRHQIKFRPWAEMFGMAYRQNEELEISNMPLQTLIEIVPDPESTSKFWNSYENLFKA